MNTDSAANPRILVIDDDEVMRELLGSLLAAQDYAVELAHSGEEGLAVLRRPEAPALVLTDLQMPGLEGEALTTALRGAARPETLILGMSGRQPTAAVLLPLNGFLAKPFSYAQLAEALAAAAESRGALWSPTVVSQAEQENNSSIAAQESAEIQFEPPVLDEVIFGALLNSFKPAQMLELYALTLDDVRARHGRMLAYAAEGELEAVQREAHAVKGGCGMVGARELGSLAAAVEGGTTINTPALVEIPAACDRLRRMLDAKLQPKW